MNQPMNKPGFNPIEALRHVGHEEDGASVVALGRLNRVSQGIENLRRFVTLPEVSSAAFDSRIQSETNHVVPGNVVDMEERRQLREEANQTIDRQPDTAIPAEVAPVVPINDEAAKYLADIRAQIEDHNANRAA